MIVGQPKPAIRWAMLTLALWLCPTVRAEWKIPDPNTTEHPGATEAPASDPRTYPDKRGFQERSQIILKGLAGEDLAKWRTGYFAGGDPGKYLPGAAMAKLLLNPADAEARRYMNDERSYKEHYHFAAVNWARFLPLFGDALTPETRAKLAKAAARYGDYLSPRGTENHKTMWWTSANVLPHYLSGGRLANRDKDAALAQTKEMLRSWVKGIYQAGQGEWDSSTYLMFTVNGLLNIYDFSPDPEARLLAKAALDWLIAAYALKYTDGIYAGPHQRGYAGGVAASIADQTGWLWWGSNRTLTPEDARDFRYTLAAITSSWRPNQVITNIARQSLATLPFEQRNSKANYWHGLNQPPTPGVYHETVYATRHYTLASLWNGYGGQFTRFQLVAASPHGGIPFTGGHPTTARDKGKIIYKYGEGQGDVDQSAQVGGAYISLSKIPDKAELPPLPYSFFSIPEGATPPVQKGRWFIMQAGSTFIGVYPLSEQAKISESDLGEKQREENEYAIQNNQPPRHKGFPILRFEGRRTGFILQTADVETVKSSDEFAAALQQRTKIDTSQWAEAMEVTYTSLDGKTIRIKYQDGQDRAAVSIDGAAVSFDNWPVYSGPYLNAQN
ncbi:MAG: hypothetical protein M3347_03750, partial [Armatimonadota bacterium]|nr:hypothetical protein [Armatimonadota bacterium]